MKRLILRLALLAGVWLGAAAASANDSGAEVGAGGIELVKSTGIAMLSEDLTISVGEVRVAYHFRNETAAAITTRVAFPVPEVDAEVDQDRDLDLGAKNPMHFSVTVDGKRTPFQTEIKKRRGRVKLTYHWVQTFPPGQDLLIEHRYKPVAGSFFGPSADFDDAEMDRDLAKAYCVGPGLLAALKKGPQKALSTVHYILTSGANWKGPIRAFKLTLAKGSANEKISICLPDTRKASPTTFVVERKDFTPTEDLRVLFIPGG